jgi:hypothetical protein
MSHDPEDALASGDVVSLVFSRREPSPADALQLMRAFVRIKSPVRRSELIALAEKIALE